MFRKLKNIASFSPKPKEENIEDKSEQDSMNFKALTHNLILCYLGHLTLKLATDPEQQQERKFKSTLVIAALTQINQANSREQVKDILFSMLTEYTNYMEANRFVIGLTDGMNQISKHLDELKKADVVAKNTVKISTPALRQ